MQSNRRLLGVSKTLCRYKMIDSKFDLKYSMKGQSNCKYKDCSSLIHACLIKKNHQFHPFLCAKSLLMKGGGGRGHLFEYRRLLE